MKKLYADFLQKIDAGNLKRCTEELAAIEMGQTFRHYRMAAEYVLKLMQKNGFSNAEIIDFPADGRTVFQDKKMPLAWDASIGRLTLLDAPEEEVVADYSVHPFHLIKGSVATPPEGLVTRIITEQQFLAGEDPRGALIMLEPMTWPRANVLVPILDQGGLGIISDFVMGRYKSPDSLQWVNACTEGTDWHVTEEDRPFIGFTVSAKVGNRIRQQANSGALKVRVECDGRRYSGKLPLITAMLPGKRKQELWIIAHMYEPLLNDDSNGVIAGIEAARQIMLKGTPEYSLRLVFAMELYGYAAYTASRGSNLKNEVIGGCNLDGLGCVSNETMDLYAAGPAVPFFGNDLLKDAEKELKDVLNLKYKGTAYFDDMFIGDPTVGVPTVWLHGRNGGFWHNSMQCSTDFIDWKLFHKNTAMAAAYLYKVANYTGKASKKIPVTIEPIQSPWRDYARQMRIARKEAGFPHSLAKVPQKERISLPGGVMYDAFANVLCNMDGEKDLAQIIREAETETGKIKTEAEVKKYIDSVNFLVDYGYLEAIERPVIKAPEILEALQELGVARADVLLVHASVSKCGYIDGGAETVIKSIAAAAETVLFPTFTRPYIYLGGLNKGYNYRPYDPADYDAIWTGSIGKTLLRKFPEAIRSSHVTHSWAGLGCRAAACLDSHEACDSPTGRNSPMGKALDMDGKILYFGTGVAPTTFLHYLEDICNVPYLEAAVCRVKNPDSSLQTVLIEKHLPGHRDFYRKDAENCKFFRRAVADGLEIHSIQLGMGKLQLIDLRRLYEIGMHLLSEDPCILLCDDPNCLYCRKYH